MEKKGMLPFHGSAPTGKAMMSEKKASNPEQSFHLLNRTHSLNM